MIAQMGSPDMKLPIQYALTYPERWFGESEYLDLAELGKLTFESPDLGRFPCIGAAYRAVEIGGTMPAVLSVADEIAVDSFLKGCISFTHIAQVIENTLSSHSPLALEDMSDLFEAESWAREFASEEVKKIATG
jgi:1-deoxy-D-xylulose-5-phosphate reductoisomerase